jgi:flagellar FliL protein
MSQAPAAAPVAATVKADAKPKAKGKGKLLIIIAGAVVLLGGGAGAFFLMKGGEKKDAPTAAKKEAVKLPSIYVPLDPPFVVNFDSGQGARFLQITVQLMTRAPELAEFIKAHDPVIRNDLLLMFGNQKVEEVSTREGKEKLRESALQAVRKIIGSEGGKAEALEALYFTSFVMQ